MAETVKRSIVLSRKLVSFLEKEAARRGITVSDLMRRIMDDHWAQQEADRLEYKIKKQLAMNDRILTKLKKDK